jgi:hypothetical protein
LRGKGNPQTQAPKRGPEQRRKAVMRRVPIILISKRKPKLNPEFLSADKQGFTQIISKEDVLIF